MQRQPWYWTTEDVSTSSALICCLPYDLHTNARVTSTVHKIQSSSCKLSPLHQVSLEKESGPCHTKLNGLSSRTLLCSCGGTAPDNSRRCTQGSFQSRAWKAGVGCLTCTCGRAVWTETPLQVHLCKQNLAINPRQFKAQHLALNTQGHVIEANMTKHTEELLVPILFLQVMHKPVLLLPPSQPSRSFQEL